MFTTSAITPNLTMTPIRPARTWKRTGGYTTGVVLSLAGLVLSATAAATYTLRAAGANLPAEPGLAVALRCAGGVGLVIIGFSIMVLCARGVEAHEPTTTDRATELATAISGGELLCDRCGAANDHLARYCDQCGKRL